MLRPRKTPGMATVVKTQRPEDFLALVPQLAGFRPRNSIIIVAFRGNRTCAAIRFNVPGAQAPGSDSDSALHYSTVASRLIGILCKVRGADAVVPVVYTDDRFANTASIPHAAFVEVLVDRARNAGFLVRDALCVAADGWGSYLDEVRPAQGRPLAAIESSPVHGVITHEERNGLLPVDAGSDLPTVDLATKERVARHIVGLREFIGTLRDLSDPSPTGHDGVYIPHDIDGDDDDDGDGDGDGDDDDDDGDRDGDDLDDNVDDYADGGGYNVGDYTDSGEYPANRYDDDEALPRNGWLPGYAEEALQLRPDSIDDRAAAVLILCLQSPMARDVVMLQWAFGLEVGELALEENARYFDGADPAEFLVAPLMWGDGPRPNVPRVLAAITLVKAIAARAPRSTRPPLLCQLAWFNWALGRSSLAGRFIEEAERIDDRYGLAELLRSMLDAGHLPEWAFAIPDDDRTP